MILTDKPIAAVAIRDTLAADDFVTIPGDPAKGARGLLEALKRDGFFVLIADPLLNTPDGQRQALIWLNLHELPYDELYVESGIPAADVYVNGRSVKEWS